MANKIVTTIGVAGLGAIILWSGITNTGILLTIQSIIRGTQPVPGVPQNSSQGKTSFSSSAFSTGPNSVVGNGSAVGQAIASDAMQYQGGTYVWGGTVPNLKNGSTFPGNGRGVDCYGLLTYVLHTDLGYNLPNNTHSGYLEMMAWTGAVTIPTSQVQAGDLILWPTHCGIAISSTEMVSAENPSIGVQVNTFTGGGPLAPEPMTVRRVIGSVVTA